MSRFIALTALAAALATPALAQQDADSPEPELTADGRRVIRPEVQRIDFNAVDVTATNQRPSLDLIEARTSAVFAPMIKVRKDFNEEISASVTTVR